MIAGNKTTVNGSMNCYVQESPSVKRRCYAFVKRAFDIVASAAALIILSPIMLIAAILVYVDDPGKVFYGHVRIGKNGKPFKMWKFRSMYIRGFCRTRTRFWKSLRRCKRWMPGILCC